MVRRIVVVSLVALVAALALGLFESVGNVAYHALQGERAELPWTIRRTLPVWLSFALVAPFAAFMARRFRFEPGRRGRDLLAHLVGGLGYVALHLTVLIALQRGPLHHDDGRHSFAHMLAWLFSYYVAVELCIYGGIVAAFLVARGAREARERATAAAQLEARLAEARLAALRARLEPHFLFNALNGIAALALRGEGPRVAEALGRLSELLRASLDDALPQEIALARELELLERYLEIQRLRFPDRLSVVREIAPEALGASVPSLLLQPLVENAVQHGVAARGGGAVTLVARREGNTLAIEVRDSGPGFSNGNASRGLGVGLASTRERLAVLYGAAQSLETSDGPAGGGVVRLRLPFRAAAPGTPAGAGA